MKISLRIAYYCWFIPFILGVAIFEFWLISDAKILVLAGFANILLGCGLFVVGGISLIAHCLLAQTPEGTAPDFSLKPVLWTGALLLSNFPLAYGLAVAAVKWRLLH